MHCGVCTWWRGGGGGIPKCTRLAGGEGGGIPKCTRLAGGEGGGIPKCTRLAAAGKEILKRITCARNNRFKKCVAIKIAVLKKIVTGSQYQPDSDEDNSGTVN